MDCTHSSGLDPIQGIAKGYQGLYPAPMATPNRGDLLTVTQAAQRLGVSKNTVRAWADAGKLRHARHPINRYRLFDPAVLDELLAQIRSQVDAPLTRKPKRTR